MLNLVSGAWNRVCNLVYPRDPYMDGTVSVTDAPPNAICAGCNEHCPQGFRVIDFSIPSQNSEGGQDPAPAEAGADAVILRQPRNFDHVFYDFRCLGKILFPISTNSLLKDSVPYLVGLIATNALFSLVLYKTRNVQSFDNYVIDTLVSYYAHITFFLNSYFFNNLIYQKNKVLRLQNRQRLIPKIEYSFIKKGDDVVALGLGPCKVAYFDQAQQKAEFYTDVNQRAAQRLIVHEVPNPQHLQHVFVHSDPTSPAVPCGVCHLPLDLRQTPDYILSRNKKILRIAFYGLLNLAGTYLAYRFLKADRLNSIPLKIRCFGQEFSLGYSAKSYLVSFAITSAWGALVDKIFDTYHAAQVHPLLSLVAMTPSPELPKEPLLTT